LAFLLASHDRDVLFHGNHNRVGGVGGKHRAVKAQSDMGMIRLGKSKEFFGANFMDIRFEILISPTYLMELRAEKICDI